LNGCKDGLVCIASATLCPDQAADALAVPTNANKVGVKAVFSMTSQSTIFRTPSNAADRRAENPKQILAKASIINSFRNITEVVMSGNDYHYQYLPTLLTN
jgi:hypothetical protein